MFGIFYVSKIGSFKQTSWPILFIFRAVTSKYKKNLSIYTYLSAILLDKSFLDPC